MNEKQRICVGCRNLQKSDELIKIKLNNEGVIINPDEYLTGRSSYLCYNMECVEKALKYGKFDKSFKRKIKIPENIRDVLYKIINDRKDKLSLAVEK